MSRGRRCRPRNRCGPSGIDAEYPHASEASISSPHSKFDGLLTSCARRPRISLILCWRRAVSLMSSASASPPARAVSCGAFTASRTAFERGGSHSLPPSIRACCVGGVVRGRRSFSSRPSFSTTRGPSCASRLRVVPPRLRRAFPACVEYRRRAVLVVVRLLCARRAAGPYAS